MGIKEKTEMLQGDGYILSLRFDDGMNRNVKLIDKENIYNNKLQEIEAAYSKWQEEHLFDS